jgi:hypothetical protein
MKQWKAFYCWHDRKYGQYAAGVHLFGHWKIELNVNGPSFNGWRESFVLGAQVTLTKLSIFVALVDLHFEWWG